MALGQEKTQFIIDNKKREREEKKSRDRVTLGETKRLTEVERERETYRKINR